MEIRHLRALLVTAEELHFGRAATRLAITQPALSQQIAQLEALVETKLFERHPRIAPTEAGKVLIEHARRILGLVAEAESEVRSLANLSHLRIRLGYLEYWNPPFLASALRVLRDREPAVLVESRNMHPHEVIAGLRDRTLDFGFVHLPIDEPDLATRLLVEGTWAVIFKKSHRLARKAQLVLADLDLEPLIFFDRSINPPSHAWLLGRFAEAKVGLRIAYSTTQPSVGVELVEEGVGSYIVGSYVVRKLPPELVMRTIVDLPPLRIAGAWRGDNRTPAITALLAALPRARATG